MTIDINNVFLSRERLFFDLFSVNKDLKGVLN